MPAEPQPLAVHGGGTGCVSATSHRRETRCRGRRTGLANSQCVTFESANEPGYYLRHSSGQLQLDSNDGSALFANDATFCPQAGNSGTGYSLMSNNYSDSYVRHYNGVVCIATDGGTKHPWDASSLWPDDTTWAEAAPWS